MINVWGFNMAVVPIIIPVHSRSSSHISGVNCFVPSYDERYINIGASTECGTYKSLGEWWIWFKIEGNTKYFAYPYSSKKEADDELIKLLNKLEENNKK
jgi:hypothetical protein